MNNDFWGNVTGNKEDAFANTSYGPIPGKTRALATIHAFQEKFFGDKDYYEIDWLLSDGEYTNRHVFQKIHVYHQDLQKQIKARNIVAYLHNMYKLELPNGPMKARDFANFLNKPAIILIEQTSPNENGKIYNWVSEILAAPSVTQTAASDDFDMDIPF